jgi:hypothetical protein
MHRHIFLIFIIMSSFIPLEPTISAQLRLDFSQDNRTYVWNTNLDCDRKVERGLSWGFSSAINSTLIKRSIFSNNQNRWQEDGKVNLDLSYPLTRRLKIGALFSQTISSLEKRKVTSSEYGITSEYDLYSFRLSQTIGAKQIDRRLEGGKRKDAGFNHQLEIHHSSNMLSRSITLISLSQTISRLTNIPIIERNLNLFFVKKSFSGEDSLEFSFWDSWSKKKFYRGDLTDSQINTQRKTQRLITLRSSLRMLLGLKVDFDFDFMLNGYKYSGEPASYSSALTDNSLHSQNSTLKVQRSFFKRLIVGSFYKYIQTEEDYADEQKNQKMESGEWGGDLTIRMSKADSLHLSTSIGVASFYASRLSAQSNDRDVLTLFSWGEYSHIFNPFFSLRLEGGFRNLHQIYISNRLSANNNHNQTYVLSPTLIWKPHSRLELKQNYNIQANYIYYDYEKSKESTKNRLFRRASLSTNMKHYFTTRVNFTLEYSYRYEDYGQLIWKDQWVQKPSWEQRTHTISYSLNYMPESRWTFSPEYTYQRRKSWDHFTNLVTLKKSRTLSDKFSQTVISLSCKYVIDDQNYIKLSSARRVQKSWLYPKGISDYASVSVNRFF